jgi:hypothetical protein
MKFQAMSVGWTIKLFGDRRLGRLTCGALRPMGHRLTLRYGWNRISADDSFWKGTDLEWQSHPNLLQRSEGASYW